MNPEQTPHLPEARRDWVESTVKSLPSLGAPELRLGMLVKIQLMIGYLMRDYVTECRDAGLSWREIADRMEMEYPTVHRQYHSGRPMLASPARTKHAKKGDSDVK